MEKDYDAIIPTPFGAVGICAQDDFLTGVDLLNTATAEKLSPQALVQNIANQLNQYFRDPHTSLDVPFVVKGTAFQKRVWQAIAAIPCGQTLTYGELAAKVGSGPRAVANVCGANSVPLIIPCHRVVAKNGLGGFNQGKDKKSLAVKQWLLSHEKNALESEGSPEPSQSSAA